MFRLNRLSELHNINKVNNYRYMNTKINSNIGANTNIRTHCKQLIDESNDELVSIRRDFEEIKKIIIRRDTKININTNHIKTNNTEEYYPLFDFIWAICLYIIGFYCLVFIIWVVDIIIYEIRGD